MREEIKIKPLSKSQIILAVDRLTRFKPTEEKYLRVFRELITSNLIYPKYKKKEIELIKYENLTALINEIFSKSLNTLNFNLSTDFSINEKLLDYEKSVFNFDKNTEKLVNNKINYSEIIKLFEDDNLPFNLKWLKSLSKDSNQTEDRANFGFKFPIEKIVIAEGITEEILLPKFARLCDFDFDKMGVHIISAGGKNQVVKLFYQYADVLKLPIFVLLDKDAEENLKEIEPKLRKKDKIHILKCGEFEDLLTLNLIKRTLNRYFRNYFSIKLEDLRKDLPMTKTLGELFKNHGLEFKKAEFAALVAKNIQDEKDVSDEIKFLISEINITIL